MNPNFDARELSDAIEDMVLADRAANLERQEALELDFEEDYEDFAEPFEEFEELDEYPW